VGDGGVTRNAPYKIGVGEACAFAQRLEEKHNRTEFPGIYKRQRNPYAITDEPLAW
jgi:hypothetical protein